MSAEILRTRVLHAGWTRIVSATVKDAGGPVFASFAANQPAATTALMYQNGAQPFEYDPAAAPDHV